ncbi:unnamed protein product [Lepidochelys kempii]
MSERPLLDFSVATCKKIRCRITYLEMHQLLEFMIKGNFSFQWVSQTQQQKVSLVSEARIEYEEQKYNQKEGFVQRQFGFFQRQYKQMMEDAVEGEGPGPTRSATPGNPPASDAPKQ